MNAPSFPPLPERNPVTHAHHRREVLWQISLPFILVLVGFITLSVLSALGNNGDVSRWADISTIWLVMLVLVPALILLIVLAALTYGLIRLIQILPKYALRLQMFFRLVQSRVDGLSDRLVEPVLRIHSFTAGADTLRGKKSTKRRL